MNRCRYPTLVAVMADGKCGSSTNISLNFERAQSSIYSALTMPHLNKTSILFLDGHAELKRIDHIDSRDYNTGFLLSNGAFR